MNSLNTICSVTNFGTVQVISNIVPSPPTTLVYISSSATISSVNISFTAPTPPPVIASYSPSIGSGSGTASTYTISGLASNTSYSITLTATGINGKTSSASSAVSVLTIPSAPTIGTVTSSATTASIPFTAPSGSGTITGYTVTSSPGSLTGTGTSSPISVSGLTSGTAYTFTITATNASGTSVASTASNSITPVDVLTPGTATVTGFSSCTFSNDCAIYGYMCNYVDLNNTATNSITTSSGSLTMQIFAVGGGGGGEESSLNSRCGGGGGGGIVQSVITSTTADTITVVVGGGSYSDMQGNNSSVIFTNQTSKSIISYGGGSGSGYKSISGFSATSGGSGGGGNSFYVTGGSGIQGCKGGDSFSGTFYAGGGGGYSTAGGAATSTSGGVGGDGGTVDTTILTSFTNTIYATYYWAGGGGGSNAAGGKGGGGGNPGIASGMGYAWYGTFSNGSNVFYAAPHSGAGGCGLQRAAGANYAMWGGQGIVLISIPYNQITNNTTDISTTGLVHKYIFNSSTVSGTSVKNLATGLFDATLTSTTNYNTTSSRISSRGCLSAISTVGYLTVTGSPLYTTSSVTVCFWIKMQTFTAASFYVFSLGGTANGTAQTMQARFGLGTTYTLPGRCSSFIVRLGNGNITFTPGLPLTPSTGNGGIAAITLLNVWTHYTCITTSGVGATVYINGAFYATIASAVVSAGTYTPTTWQFGNHVDQAYYDDIRFYNRALTSSEIATLASYIGT